MKSTLLFLFSLLAFTLPLGAAEPLPGATSHFASVNGIRMHYVQMGKGPLLVLLHGWPQTWYEASNLTGVVAEKSGHFVPEEEPEFFVEQLESFLRK